MYAYCLYCERQRCADIARLMESWHGIRAISPVIIQRKWKKGICQEERHDWLPNYIFLYPEEPLKDKIRIPGIIRWLGNGELEGADLAFAQMLYEKNGVLGTVRLAEAGDRCVINDPLWNNAEGRILKIDRGRKRCCVEFTFDNLTRTVWLGYDLVKTKE